MGAEDAEVGGETLVHLSRGIDHLGWLNAQLRDLSGPETLASELIQNADDAPEAISISFDINDDALVVDNDGIFVDCRHAEEDVCYGRDGRQPGALPMCDFHRFRNVASGDKRRETNTVGAFGIGFVAVYQVTDRPELISSGRHWIVDETRRHEERISSCHDPECTRMHGSVHARTRFILPWATDAHSVLRESLGIEAITPETVDDIAAALRDFVPDAFLFLQKLERAEVKRSGSTLVRLERVVDEPHVVLERDGQALEWRIFRGDFGAAADALRAQGHFAGVEKKTTVSVAVPEDPAALQSGLFYAFLPTKQSTGLPLHINADFFPSSDRKRLILESGYQAAWNSLATECAAGIITQNLRALHDFVGAARFWAIMDSVQRASGDTGSPVASMWDRVAAGLRDTEIVLCADGEIRKPDEALWPRSDQAFAATALLAALGVPVVDPALRPYANLLRSSDVGVATLALKHAVATIENIGLRREVRPERLPPALRAAGAMDILWAALDSLEETAGQTQDQAPWRARLRACALAPSSRGTLAPFDALLTCSEDSHAVFAAAIGRPPFAALGTAADALVARLCRKLTPARAVSLLERALEDEPSIGRDHAVALLQWFARDENALTDEDLCAEIASLPLFPSITTATLGPLDGLALPSGFEDPLNIAQLVDVRALSGLERFLRLLGAEELDLHHYIVGQLQQAFDARSFSNDEIDTLLAFLAAHLANLEDDEEAQRVLASLPLLKNSKGKALLPSQSYFPSAWVRRTLPGIQTVVRLETSSPSMDALLSWLGVRHVPRTKDVLARIALLSAQAPTDDSVLNMQEILRLMIERGPEKPLVNAAVRFSDHAWLPAEGDRSRWYTPSEVYAIYLQWAFSSQARFLDLPPADQRTAAASALFKALGIRGDPPLALVVAHVLHLAAQGQAVGHAVYDLLNSHPDDPAIRRMQNEACIMTASGEFVRPDQVFWSDHPFGRFRYRLDPALRSLVRLLTALGVKEQPDPEDAAAVLVDIEDEFGEYHLELDGDALAVTSACWRTLSEALADDLFDDTLIRELSKHSVVPNRERTLRRPTTLFVDDRPGWADGFGDYLADSVIDPVQDALPAWRVAGVQPLSEAITRIIDEQPGERPDPALRTLLSGRRVEIARALGSYMSGPQIRQAIDALDKLECVVLPQVLVTYQLAAFGDVRRGEPEPASACWDIERGTLYRAASAATTDVAVARELAYGMCPPGIPPGPVALVIRTILDTPSEAHAKKVLDELGFAQVDLEPLALGAGGTISQIGAEGEVIAAPSGDGVAAEKRTDGATGAQGQPPVETGAAPTTQDHELEVEPPELESAVGGETSTDAEEEWDQTAGGNGERPHKKGHAGRSSSPSGGRKPGHSRRHGPQPRQGRFVTYVFPPGSTHDGQSDTYKENAAVEQAGVQLAVEYEQSHFRYPEVMPPNHPGYDIESKDGSGETDRYIEVKATANDWREAGVGLTKKEYETALQLREDYWLYVVERAGHPDQTLYRIQDPARMVTQYFYDGGWRGVAETDG